MRPDEDPLDFPCSYTFRAYSAEINEGVDLPPLRPSRGPQPEPLDLETLKKALHQVLSDRQRFAKVVAKERAKLQKEAREAPPSPPTKHHDSFKGFPIDP